jgi:conjugal transfer pilus assembly protein TraB
MFKKLFSSLTSSSLSPGTMKARQYGILALAGVGLLGAIGLGMGGFYSISSTPSAEDFLKEKLPLKTPPEAVNPRDIWTNRVEKAAEKAGAESKTVREENIFLRKRMDEMEKAIHESSENVKQTLAKISTMIAQERQSKPALPSTGITSPSSFSPQELSPTDLKGEDRLLTGSEDITPISPSLHLTISDKRKIPFKNIDTYVPGGTYARAVLVSGVVSSTSVHKSSEPNPVILRLVDDGHLPQGFKGTMNNNVIIGACHGELSSERVHCRIERMSW